MYLNLEQRKELRKFAKNRRNFESEESTMAHTRNKMSKIARIIILQAASPRRRGLKVASRLWLCIFKQSLRDCDLTTVASRL